MLRYKKNIFVFFILVLFQLPVIYSQNTVTSGELTLRVYDDSDSKNMYTDEISFFAEFSNNQGGISDASCFFSYNFFDNYQTTTEMKFNSDLNRYELHANGSFKEGHMWHMPAGDYQYKVNCDGIEAVDNVEVLDYAPIIASSFEILEPGLETGVVYDEFNEFSKFHFSALQEELYYTHFSENFEIISSWNYTSELSFFISFETNLPAVSQVEFGKSSSQLNKKTKFSERMFFNHNHYLTNLDPGTTYYYRTVAYDERGRKILGEIKTFQTKDFGSSVVRIPQDLDGPTYDLVQDNTYYLLTQNITTNTTAIFARASNITVDLGGNTITFGEGNTQNAYGVEFLSYGGHHNIKVVNGHIRQGENPNMLSNDDSEKFTPLIFRNSRSRNYDEKEVEVAGVDIVYYASQSWGLLGRYPYGYYELHHNTFTDIGVGVTNRHGSGTRAMGYKYGPDKNIDQIYNNLVKRTRQSALSGAKYINHNEVYLDSWAANSFGIQNYHGDEGGGSSSFNKVFGTGYYAIAIPWSTYNHSFDSNFIHMEAINTQDIRWWESWGEQNVVNGFRLTQYSGGGQYRNLQDYNKNTVVVGGTNGGYFRGTEFFSDNTNYNFTMRNSILKAEVKDSSNSDGAAIVTQGYFRKDDIEPLKYINVTTYSNINNVRFGDSYGRGNNHYFINATFAKIGNNPDYHTFIFDGAYWNYGHILRNPTFLGGARFDDVIFKETATLSDYSIEWDVNVKTQPNSKVIVLNKNNVKVEEFEVDVSGEVTFPLKQVTLRPNNWEPGLVRRANTNNPLKQNHTPHTIYVIDENSNQMNSQIITVDSIKNLELYPNQAYDKLPEITLNAPKNITLPRLVEIESFVEDKDSSSLDYTWELVAGAGNAVFNDTKGSSTSIAFSDHGDYIIRLSVSDSKNTVAKEIIIEALEADDSRPELLNANTLLENNKVNVLFSEEINQSDALNISNYMLNNLEIYSASLSDDNKSVTLEVSNMSIGQTYSLQVENIKDRAFVPNTVFPNSIKNFTYTNSISINFQPIDADVPEGFIPDFGFQFSKKSPTLSYGWSNDISETTRDRGDTQDQKFDTLIHFHLNEYPKSFWEMTLPQGIYNVTIGSGDESWPNRFIIDVEGEQFLNISSTSQDPYHQRTREIAIDDGKITVAGSSKEENNKINFLIIRPISINGTFQNVSCDTCQDVNQTATNQTNSTQSNTNQSDSNSNSGSNSNSQDSSSGGSSGSSGGGGGSSSSGGGSSGQKNDGESSKSILDDLTKNDENPSRCIPSYNYSSWSSCEQNQQTRIVRDMNSCFEEEIEIRSCEVGNSEIDNQFLNAKKINLQQISQKKYETQLNGSYQEIIYVEKSETPEETVFVLRDLATNREYLARIVDEDQENMYYSIKRIDVNSLDELKESGLVEKTLREKSSSIYLSFISSGWFATVISLFIASIIFLGIWRLSAYMKKLHKKKNDFK